MTGVDLYPHIRQFAAAALTGILTTDPMADPEDVAKRAFEYANAMAEYFDAVERGEDLQPAREHEQALRRTLEGRYGDKQAAEAGATADEDTSA